MSEREADWQGPTNGKRAKTFADYYTIVIHPAFRLGFLDAQAGQPLDHDTIRQRIQAETPPNALRRCGWDADIFNRQDIELAQYRYEEGRLLVIMEGLRCKAWGHPDYPPKAVMDFICARADLNSVAPERPKFSVEMLRGSIGAQDGLPFAGRQSA